jgi:sarcosine oxidase subunit beta
MSKVFDVIIIGGGIMGCSSALELARRGFKVAVVEKETIGKGPTGKSSAIIRQHYSNKLTAHMALYSLGIFQDFEERVGGECGFTQTGFIAVVEDKDLAGLEANIALQREVGIKTALIDAKDFRELMPGVETGDLIAVAYEPESGYADPYLTVTSYAQAARRHGATFFLDTEVTGFKLSSGRIAGVRTTSHDLDAPVVINCAGAWGAAVARMAQIDLPIDSCRAQVAFFRRPLGSETPHPVVGDFINATYFRSETGGITLVGLIDPSEAQAIVDPDAFVEYSDDEFILEAGERLVNRYPVMEHSQSTGGYASLYAITPDWHPIIDQVPGDSGFYICSGFSGHGFKLGPAVGLMVADLVSGYSDPLFDPSMFGFARFADDKLVRGQYEYSIVG